jgi:hypothetical protein
MGKVSCKSKKDQRQNTFLEMIITNPFYKATPSNNAPHLFCDDPLPELKHYDNDDELVIVEIQEADYPGPEMNDGTPVMHKVEQLLKEYNKDKITFVTADLDIDTVPFAGKVKHYPFHFLNIQRAQQSVKEISTQRNKHFCSFNGAIKYKRIEFVQFCEKHNLIKNNYVSLVGNYDHGYHTQRYTFKNYYLDKDKDQLNNDDKSVPIEIYSDSFLNIINETHEEQHVFFTEKTWKPLLNGQMFLYYGVGDKSKYYEELQKLGFKMFDEFFDYEKDTLDEVIKFCNTDISEIQTKFKIIKHKLEHNKKLAETIDTKQIW